MLAPNIITDDELTLALELHGQSRLRQEPPDLPLDESDFITLRTGLELGVPLRDQAAQMEATRQPDALFSGREKARSLENGLAAREWFKKAI